MSVSLALSPRDDPRLVLDAWPVMEWLKGRRKAADYFELLIADANGSRVELFMSRINLGEIYYSTAKDWDTVRAERFLYRCCCYPLKWLVSPMKEYSLRPD